MKRQFGFMSIVYFLFGILCLLASVYLAILIMALPLLMIYVFRITLSYNTQITILLLWNLSLLLIGVVIKKRLKKRW